MPQKQDDPSSNDNLQDQMMIPGVRRPPGRPRLRDAQNDATRSRKYRARLQASGLRQVFLHLPKDLVKALDELASKRGCNRSQVTAELLRGVLSGPPLPDCEQKASLIPAGSSEQVS